MTKKTKRHEKSRDPARKSAGPSREHVLAVLRDRAPRAMHASEIAGALALPARRKGEVMEILAELREHHLVTEMPGNRYRLDKPKPSSSRDRVHGSTSHPDPGQHKMGGGADEVIGRLSRNPRGFGFVAAADGKGDIFIPPNALGGALHGDTVRAATRKSQKGREGEVLGIVERGLRRVVGTVQRDPFGDLVLVPQDLRVPGPIVLDMSPPRVPGLEEGVLAVAQMTKVPTDGRAPIVGRVIHALGRPGVASVEIRAIELREGIEEVFPDDVLAEARALPREVLDDHKRAREDLRGFDLVTIDPEDARDHDDAVWAERAPGGFRVIVAIADVSHYVREGTAIDREALARSCSVYLPDRAIPMLPHELSSGLASLVPHEDRLTLAVEVEVGANGSVRDFRYIEGVMRSGAKLSYGSAARALKLTTEGDTLQAAEDRRDQLAILLEVSTALRGKRTRRGAIDFDLPEARVKLDPKTGEPVDVYRSRSDAGVRRAYAMIEDLMLLANEVVAADLLSRAVPSIYRVHAKPDEKKLLQFSALADALGHSFDAEEGVSPRALSHFLAKVKGTPQEGALGYLLLRAMKQATYDVANIGHFGLAAASYLHFTSPIRRYPDLAVHRVVRAHMKGKAKSDTTLEAKLRTWAEAGSRLERRAMEVEREAVDVYRCILMRDRVGDEFDAVVTSVGPYGYYAALDAPYVDVLVPMESLARQDDFELDEHGVHLLGGRSGRSIALGDRVHLRIVSVSVEGRQVVGDEAMGVALRDRRNIPARNRGRLPVRGQAASRGQSGGGQRGGGGGGGGGGRGRGHKERGKKR